MPDPSTVTHNPSPTQTMSFAPGVPFHQQTAVIALRADEAAASDTASGDILETARVTAHYGRLLQSLYIDFKARETLAALHADYARRAWEDGASYGN